MENWYKSLASIKKLNLSKIYRCLQSANYKSNSKKSLCKSKNDTKCREIKRMQRLTWKTFYRKIKNKSYKVRSKKSN